MAAIGQRAEPATVNIEDRALQLSQESPTPLALSEAGFYEKIENRKIQVLIVDDEPHIRSLLKVIVSSLGAEVFPYTWHTGVLDSDLQPLETQAALFRAALEPYSGRPLWIVGHSTGGLIARQALLDLLAEGRTRPFERLALIAVPHYGVLANLLPNLLTERNPQLAQLRFGSSFLVQLQRRWQACLDENYPGGCADQLPAMVSVGGAFALPVEGDLHAYVDGTVTAASAWLPGTPLVLLQHLHPDLANVTASPETAGLLGRFFGPACQANPLTCLEDLETGGTLLERFPPQFLFVYPEAWGDPEVLFEPWFEPVAPLPSLLGRGWCCDEDRAGSKRHYVLDRTFSEELTSAGLEGWEELAVSFRDRSCGVPVRELLSLLEDRRTVILEFGAADGRGACRTKTW